MKRKNLITLVIVVLVPVWILVLIPKLANGTDWSVSNLDPPYNWAYFNGPVVADWLYGDQLEVIYWEADQLRAYDANGNPVGGTITPPTDTQFCTAPAVGDITGDGYNDLVISVQGGDNEHRSELLFYDRYGETITAGPNCQLDFNTHWAGLTLADLNGDGDMEVITVRINTEGIRECIECLAIYDYQSTYEWVDLHCFAPTIPTSFQWNQSAICRDLSPAVGDMDRDGDMEIFMHDDRGLIGAEVTNWDELEITLRFTFNCDDYFLPPYHTGEFTTMGLALADFQGDDNLELFVTVHDTEDDLAYLYFVENDNGTYSVSQAYSESDIDGIGHNTPAIADLDDNGDLQIAFGGTYYNTVTQLYEYQLLIAEYDPTNDFRSYNINWPNPISFVTAMIDHHASFPAFADINEDEDCDILTSYEDDGSGYTKAYEVADGDEITLNLSARDDNSRSIVWAGDLDYDGDMDLVYASLEDDDEVYLYCKDLSADWEPGSVEWSQFQGNARHDGLYALEWSGNISSDTYWSGRIIVTLDITFSDDAVLYIDPGTIIEFDEDTGITVSENGALICRWWEGAEPIIMKAKDNGETWDGLLFDFNDQTPNTGSEVFGCIIQDHSTQAIKAVDVDSDNLEVKDCQISGGMYGIYYHDVYESGQTDIKISDVEITGTSSAGLLLRDSDPILSYVSVTDCRFGLYMLAGSNPEYIERCNFSDNTNDGMYATGGSSPICYKVSGTSDGTNDIKDNDRDGVYCESSSYPNFGTATYYGHNNILGHHDAHDFEINNSNASGTIYAQGNYWGGNPHESWFNGDVDYSNYYNQVQEGIVSGPKHGGVGSIIDASEEEIIDQFYVAVEEAEWETAADLLDSLLDGASNAGEECHAVSLMGSLYRWSGQYSTGASAVSALQLTSQAEDFATLTCARLLNRAGNTENSLTLLNGLINSVSTDPDIAARALMDKGYLYKYGLDNPSTGNEIFEDFLESYPNHPESDIVRIELGLEPIGTSGEPGITTMASQPDKYQLYAAHPNPFNPMTNLSYYLPEGSKVSLKIYNLQGRLVTTLVDGNRSAGTHELTFDASGLASGIYICHIQAGDFSASGKVILMK